MKSLLTIVFLSFFTWLGAQDVQEVQRSLITKNTATWCSNCGSWGWNLFEDLRADNSDVAVLWSVHFSGSDLENVVSVALANNFGAVGTPKFFVDSAPQSISSSTTAQARTNIEAAVNANALLAPIANTGLILTLDNQGLLAVESKVKFFQEANGAYYLGLYVIEDKVKAFQSSIGPNAEHPVVVRTAMTTSAFGDLLAEGTISAGTEFSEIYVKDVSAYNQNNLQVIAIIWEKVGAKYEFVNAWKEDVQMPSATAEVSALGLDVSVLPNFLSGKPARVEIQSPEVVRANVFVTDLSGRQVDQLFSGDIPNGGPFVLEFFPNTLPKATYLIVVQTESGNVVRKVVVD